MEQRRFPRWPVAILVSLSLAGAFVAVASAIEGSGDHFLFAKAKEACLSVSAAGGAAQGATTVCQK
jgi:hypothetical protein